MTKQVGLIILDGIGLSENTTGNAFAQAKHPNIDKLLSEYPHCKLQASGLAVGLPKGQAGNSEIGHLNIGAGRTVRSELVRINSDIENNQFLYNPNFQKMMQLAKRKKAKVHVIGLTSYGGVHSKLTHMLRILRHCGNNGIKTVAHIIADGRDVEPGSIPYDLKEIENIDVDYGEIVKVATISGRYYAMDRDQNWDRSLKTIDAMMHKGPSYTDIEDYMAKGFGEAGTTDEFIVPAFNKNSPDTKLEKGDFVFFFNFRQDRARQICHLFKKSKLFEQESPAWALDLTLVTMVQYDGIDSDIVIYPPQEVTKPLGEVIAKAGLSQLRIAETEKYAHVTYFLDGGKEQDYENEEKVVIPSPKVATYDLQPEMSANEITQNLLANMDQFDFFVCNFANCDMVGHTGKMEPTIKAIETVDACLGQIVEFARSRGITLFITSDHGNCDKVIDHEGKPFTAHTTVPVFFICTDQYIKLKDTGGSLANIAPTILKYMELDIPKEMDKKPLL